jgi:hypothetical protein
MSEKMEVPILSEVEEAVNWREELGYTVKQKNRNKYAVIIGGKRLEFSSTSNKLFQELVDGGVRIYSPNEIYQFTKLLTNTTMGVVGMRATKLIEQLEQVFGEDQKLLVKEKLPEGHPDIKGRRKRGYKWNPEWLVKRMKEDGVDKG